MKLTAFAFENFPEVKFSSSLSKTILLSAEDNQWAWEDGDILVIAQKVVSKSENRIVNLEEVKPGNLANQYSISTGKDPRLVELILRESKRIIRTRKGLITILICGFCFYLKILILQPRQ